VIYMTLDRPENKLVREYFTSQSAVYAAKKGDQLNRAPHLAAAARDGARRRKDEVRY